MKQHIALGPTLLAGVAIGATAIQGRSEYRKNDPQREKNISKTGDFDGHTA